LAKWLPLPAKQRVRATAAPTFGRRDLTVFNDENSAFLVLVFSSALGCVPKRDAKAKHRKLITQCADAQGLH